MMSESIIKLLYLYLIMQSFEAYCQFYEIDVVLHVYNFYCHLYCMYYLCPLILECGNVDEKESYVMPWKI